MPGAWASFKGIYFKTAHRVISVLWQAEHEVLSYHYCSLAIPCLSDSTSGAWGEHSCVPYNMFARLFIDVPHCGEELWGSIIWLKLKGVLNVSTFRTAKVSNIISPSSLLFPLLHLWRNNYIILRFWGLCFHLLSSQVNTEIWLLSNLKHSALTPKPDVFGTFIEVHLVFAFQITKTLSWVECGLWRFCSSVRKIWSIGWLTTDLFIFPGLNHCSNLKFS